MKEGIDKREREREREGERERERERVKGRGIEHLRTECALLYKIFGKSPKPRNKA